MADQSHVVQLKAAKWRLAINPIVQGAKVAAQLHAIERVPAEGPGKMPQLIPIRFIAFDKLGKDDRLAVTFDALALADVIGRAVSKSKIIHGEDRAVLTVNIARFESEVRNIIDKVVELVANASPPDLVLVRHCVECEFRDRCRKKAVEKDDLSLLAGMSPRERKHLHKKGIFTVTQYSYTFRPRRPRKRSSTRPEKYQPALKALAIREEKIHIVGRPQLAIDATPVCFDVEGLPDRHFFYLIGGIVKTAEGCEPFSFWADNSDDERIIWTSFLTLLSRVPNPILVHYGSFESAFLKRMSLRYGIPAAHDASIRRPLRQPFNLLSFIFGHIYFPTYSNGLKEIGKLIGAKWQSPDASGIQSVVWRYEWEQTRSDRLKTKLIAYNRDDCQAVYLLLSELQRILKTAASRDDVDFAYAPKHRATEQGAAIHGSFKAILASAYSHNRIRIRERKEKDQPRASARPKRISPINARDFGVKQARIVSVATKRKCKIDKATLLPSEQSGGHTIIDLTFNRRGCTKVVTTYMGRLARCALCGSVYLPPTVQRLQQQIFGNGFAAWVAYQRVSLRLPLGVIAKATFDLFGIDLNPSSAAFLVSRVASDHEQTEKLLWSQLLRSAVLHIDETKINIRGHIQYVWVFTNGKHVGFRLTITRETAFLQELLAGYQGTLVSDFYPGYDSIPCRQQKCLVHLIRDLNDDLWQNPFTVEFEHFVMSFRDLLVPILEGVERFGLKQRHLHKHQRAVEQFYQRSIATLSSTCELVAKYQRRFLRYKQSLFQFLDCDGVPWHNNAAERAIRHFAVQRKISGYFYSKGATEYLRLLGIAQTCRFQEKSFLHFLLSDCTDVDTFKEPKRRKPQLRYSPSDEE
jgi:predicted RecB family nuclease